MSDAVGDEPEQKNNRQEAGRKRSGKTKPHGSTHEVKPSTHTFFQMFLLWKSSWKDRWGLAAGAGSASSSAAGEQRPAQICDSSTKILPRSPDVARRQEETPAVALQAHL